jgi:hypothetical protein
MTFSADFEQMLAEGRAGHGSWLENPNRVSLRGVL